MIDAAEALSLLFFFLVVAVPYAIYLFTSYEGPPSIGTSFRRIGEGVVGAGLLWLVFNFARFGTSFDAWNWGPVVGVLIAAPTMLAIDWLVLRRASLRKTL